MKARPILFSSSMVLALLDGRKTQTRRIAKPQPDVAHWQGLQRMSSKNGKARFRVVGPDWPDSDDDDIFCPYGKPGDLLWVRETHSLLESSITGRAAPVWYWADGNPPEGNYGNIRPSIHLHRWASRLTLRITDVRVQRLHEISEADAWAEGVCEREVTKHYVFAGNAFRDLWDRINGPGAWDANPWCWCLTFKVIKANVDQVLKKAA